MSEPTLTPSDLLDMVSALAAELSFTFNVHAEMDVVLEKHQGRIKQLEGQARGLEEQLKDRVSFRETGKLRTERNTMAVVLRRVQRSARISDEFVLKSIGDLCDSREEAIDITCFALNVNKERAATLVDGIILPLWKRSEETQEKEAP